MTFSWINSVNLSENILALCCQLASIVLMGRLLLRVCWSSSTRIKHMSAMLIVYLGAQWLMTVGCLPFRLLYVFWFPPPYPAWPLFWVSLPNSNFLAVSSWPAFFVTLDRCLAIAVPIQSISAQKRRLWYAQSSFKKIAIGTIAAFYALSTLAQFAFSMPGADGSVAKYKNTCQLLIKCSSGLLNLVASASFLYLFKRSGIQNVKNHVAIFTMLCDLALNTLPNLTNYLLITTLNFGLSDYVGSFGVPLAAVDCAACAVYYTHVFLPNGAPPRVAPASRIQTVSRRIVDVAPAMTATQQLPFKSGP